MHVRNLLPWSENPAWQLYVATLGNLPVLLIVTAPCDTGGLLSDAHFTPVHVKAEGTMRPARAFPIQDLVPARIVFGRMLGSFPPAVAHGLLLISLTAASDPALTCGILKEYAPQSAGRGLCSTGMRSSADSGRSHPRKQWCSWCSRPGSRPLCTRSGC